MNRVIAIFNVADITERDALRLQISRLSAPMSLDLSTLRKGRQGDQLFVTVESALLGNSVAMMSRTLLQREPTMLISFE